MSCGCSDNINYPNGCGSSSCTYSSSTKSDQVLYSGPNLPCSGIDNNDNLSVALQKIDNVLCNPSGLTVTASNGLNKNVLTNDIKMGGPLTEITTIGTSGTNTLSLTGLATDPDPDYILVQTSLGVVRKALATSISNNITLKANVGLEFSNPNELSTKYNTLVPDTVTSVQVGGAAPTLASVWKTKTLVEVLNTILFPLQLPTYANPTIDFGTIPSGLREVGSVVSLSLVPSAVKNAAGAFTQFNIFKQINGGTYGSLGGNITSITESTAPALPDSFPGFPNNNNPNHTYTATSATSDNLTIPAPLTGNTSSSVTYKVSGNYNSGVANQDSLGNLDTRTAVVRQPANGPQRYDTGFESGEKSITGIYPYFWGVSANDPNVPTPPTSAEIAVIINGFSGNNNLTCTKVLESSAGTITINFTNTSSKYLWFAYPDNAPAKQSWYVTDINKGAIGPGNTWNGVANQNLTSSPNGYWSSIPYKIYITTFATFIPGGGSFQFRNNPI